MQKGRCEPLCHAPWSCVEICVSGDSPPSIARPKKVSSTCPLVPGPSDLVLSQEDVSLDLAKGVWAPAEDGQVSVLPLRWFQAETELSEGSCISFGRCVAPPDLELLLLVDNAEFLRAYGPEEMVCLFASSDLFGAQ